MNDNELRDLLTQLHARLGSARSLNADDRNLLVTVLGDIEKVLETSDAGARPDVPRLESLAVKFEAEPGAER